MDKNQELIESALLLAEKKLGGGEPELAEILCEQIIKVSPNKQAYKILGLAQHARGDGKKALEALQKSLEQDPNDFEVMNNLSLIYYTSGELDKSIPLLEQAIKLSPEKGYLYSNLGLQYRKNTEYEKAIQTFEKARSLEETPFLLCMMGGCYGEMLKLDKAETLFRQAIALDENFHPAYVDLAYCLQLQKRYEEAWSFYEKRYEVYPQTKFWKSIYDPEKAWKGEDLNNKKILVHSEQGLGDVIHFVRYLKTLKQKNCDIILHCQPSLLRLLSPLGYPIISEDPGQMKTKPEFDYHISLLSLPFFLKNTPIIGGPYLFVKEKFDYSTYPGFRIGVVWAGSPQHPNDRYRSCHLSCFREINQLPNVKMFSLQKELRPRCYHDSQEIIDLCAGCDDMKLIDLSDSLHDFYDTAMALNGLDLLITVDTAIAHLAGAMGIKTWLLIPVNPDWRWGTFGNQSEWYSSIKIFRQVKRGNWKSVFRQIQQELTELIHGSNSVGK